MVPSDDWGHIGARNRLDPLLSIFVDCVCEVTIFGHRRRGGMELAEDMRVPRLHSRRHDLANAAVAASRVSA
jgi:hypothetical protein